MGYITSKCGYSANRATNYNKYVIEQMQHRRKFWNNLCKLCTIRKQHASRIPVMPTRSKAESLYESYTFRLMHLKRHHDKSTQKMQCLKCILSLRFRKCFAGDSNGTHKPTTTQVFAFATRKLHQMRFSNT